MRTYKIEVCYQTGDSYHSEDVTRRLEMSWKKVENAKKALRRIKEHYAWYQYVNDPPYMLRPKVDEPAWHKEQTYDFVVSLTIDNGRDVTFIAPWCGFFEKLHNAKILLVDSRTESVVQELGDSD